MKQLSKTPKGYQGISSTNKHLGKLLPELLKNIEENYAKKTSHVLEMWPKIIGETLSPFTEAVSLREGVLTIKVKSSTLLSLLTNQEKERILKVLQKRFSKEVVKKLVFRIG